jgi:ABC-type branched-subunit amino acid transport system substrate-binding protein
MRIGIIAPLSSEYNYFGVPVANGLGLALEEAQADGLELTVEVRDNESEPDRTRECIAELDELGSVAILGPVESHMAAIGAEESQLRRLPVITPSGTASYITREPNPWFFRAISPDRDRTDALARWAMRDLDGAPILVVHEVKRNPDGDNARPLYGESAGIDFLEVLSAAEYPHTTLTFHRDNPVSRELKTEAIRQFSEEGIEAAAIFAPMTHLIGVGEYLRDRRPRLPIYTISPGRDLFRRSSIQDGVKAVTDTIIEDTDAVDLVEFRAKYQQRFPNEPDDPVAQYATFGYDTGRIVTAAMQNLGPTDVSIGDVDQQRDALREEIRRSPPRTDLLMSMGNFVGNNDLMFKPSRRVLNRGVWKSVSRQEVVLRGGTRPTDPEPDDDLEPRYDAFLSYRHQEPDSDFAWEIWEKLTDLGYRVAIDEKDFHSALTFLEEIERCVKDSRYTLAVISPRYLESGNTTEEAILTQIMDMNDRTRTLIALILEEVEEMPLWLFARGKINFDGRGGRVDPYEKLLRDLGEPRSEP